MKNMRTLFPKLLLAGLFSLPVLSGCTFSLHERPVCPEGGCPPPTMADMATAPDLLSSVADPNANGPFLFSNESLPVPTDLRLAQNTLSIVWPSDEGTVPSSKQPNYPLVVMMPAQSLSLSQMRSYADRLATHGIAVALVKVSDERRQIQYRDTVLSLVTFLTQQSSAKSRIAADRIGLFGYQLGGMVAASALSKGQGAFRSAFLVDPVAVLSFTEPLDALKDTASIAQGKQAPFALLGEVLSKVGEPGVLPCTPPDANFEQFYSKASGAAFAVVFGGATLSDFVGTYPDNCGTPTADRATTLRLAVKFAAAYFQWTLLDRLSARDYLLGDAFAQDGAKHNLTQNRKGF